MICPICEQETNEILTTEIREGPGTVYHCRTCDLGMLEPIHADLKKFYAEEYRKKSGPYMKRPASYEEIFNTYVKFQDQRVKAIEPYLGTDKTLLDVGCSTGHFIAHLHGKVREAQGLDWDTEAETYAMFRTGWWTWHSLEQTAAKKYDIIYSSMTMEHVSNPYSFLLDLRGKLKKDGTIYIEVPNLHDALLTVYKNAAYKKFYFRQAHLFYFSPLALQKLMEKAGFDGTIIFMQDYNIMNHLYWQSFHQPQESAEIGLKRLSDIDDLYRQLLCELKISDNMAFIGKIR